jgi:cell division protein ZapA
LSVNSNIEEEGMRKAAANINQLISKYEKNYAVSDKQDVLAMCALQFASKLEISTLDTEETNTEALDKIHELTKLVSAHLE